ncbi:hypothetical protein L6R53_17800 [Myxococcota bacterium]|nr:hypothetical protein [Myxococcota bacterium]
MRRALSFAHLPACEKNLLRVLLEVVDWTTWSCPITEQAEGGVSMEFLGLQAGWTGRRRAQMVMRRLEARHLVVTVHRGWQVNYYRLDVAQILQLGATGKEDRQRHLEERRARRVAVQQAAAPSPQVPLVPDPEPPASSRPSPAAPAPSPAAPTWAEDLGQRHTMPVAKVAQAVRIVLEGAFGEAGATRRMAAGGDDAKRILGRWLHDGRPADLEGWAIEVGQSLSALATCEAQGVRAMRARDQHRDLRYLFRASNWPRVREVAWAHRARECGCSARDVAAPEAWAEPRPDPGLLLHEGARTRVFDGPVTLATWDQALATVRERAPHAASVLESVVPAGHEAGVLWLAAISRFHVEYIVEHHAHLLAELLGPFGLVYPRA